MDGYQRLAIDVVTKACDDMRSDKPDDLGLRVSAAAWLVSRRAIPWFDIIGADHDFILEKFGWRELALAIWSELSTTSRTHQQYTKVQDDDVRLLAAYFGFDAGTILDAA